MSPAWRKEDPRPPIEVLGGEAPLEEPPARVSLGGSGGGRRLSVVAVGVLLALVAAGLVLGGDDQREQERERPTSSSTRRRATTTSAPPVTAPHGPVLPVATGAAVVLVNGFGPWVHLDLDTGTRTEVRVGDAGEFAPALGVRGGVVVTSERGARYVPLPSGEPVDLGQAGQVLAADRSDEVWLLSGPSYWFGDEPPPGERDRARVLGLDGAARSAAIEIPDGHAAGSTAHGLVVVAGGRVYLLDRTGGVRVLATGDVLGTSRHHVVLSSCDDLARCGVVLLDVRTGRSRPLDVALESTRFGLDVVVSPEDDAFALLVYGPVGPTLTLGTLVGGPLSGSDEPLWGAGPVWLPDGQGLLVVSPSGTRPVSRLQIVDGRIERHPIPALAEDRGDYVVVIPE